MEQHSSPDDKKQDSLTAIHTLETENEAIRSAIAAGKLSEATTMLAGHATKIKDLEKDLGKKGFMNAAPGQAADTAPTPSPMDLGLVGLSVFAGLGLRGTRFSSLSPQGWRTLLGGLDLIVLVFALVASVALGLKLLWVDNATWGTVNDYVVALLWGLGLHQISNAAFEGLGGVVDKWGK